MNEPKKKWPKWKLLVIAWLFVVYLILIGYHTLRIIDVFGIGTTEFWLAHLALIGSLLYLAPGTFFFAYKISQKGRSSWVKMVAFIWFLLYYVARTYFFSLKVNTDSEKEVFEKAIYWILESGRLFHLSLGMLIWLYWSGEEEIKRMRKEAPNGQ